MEWEFFSENDRNNIDITNFGKTIKKIRGERGLIKLSNKFGNNTKREYNVTLREIKDSDHFCIGLSDIYFQERLSYDHDGKTISDDNNDIKQIKSEVKKGDTLVITDKVLTRLEDEKKIFVVTMCINTIEVARLMYEGEEHKQFFLWLLDNIEVDLEVVGMILFIIHL